MTPYIDIIKLVQSRQFSLSDEKKLQSELEVNDASS